MKTENQPEKLKLEAYDRHTIDRLKDAANPSRTADQALAASAYDAIASAIRMARGNAGVMEAIVAAAPSVAAAGAKAEKALAEFREAIEAGLVKPILDVAEFAPEPPPPSAEDIERVVGRTRRPSSTT